MKLAHSAIPFSQPWWPIVVRRELARLIEIVNRFGRAVRVEGDIDAPVPEVKRVFTTSEGTEEFFAEKANIGLAVGGPSRSSSTRKTSAPAQRD